MDSDAVAASFFVLVFFAIHLASRRLEHLREEHRSFILSVAGGVSAAYVFLHLLPDLEEHGETLNGAAPFLPDEIGIYLVALLGLIVFFAIERLVVRSEGAAHAFDGQKDVGLPLFWTHIGVFAFNSFVIGHLLFEHDNDNNFYMLLYAIALALHFVTNDHALRLRHSRLHQRHGRWVLAGSVLFGWGFGVLEVLPDALLAAFFAFLAGGIIFNVMKEELPPDSGGSFTAFFAGATGYALLLILAAGHY